MGPGAVPASTAAEATPRGAEDMRLWSFGDCDARFPYVSSEEHRQCVRVVGSDEARDARALRLCQTSHARDPDEAARCKSAYKANKERAAQDGYVPHAAAHAPAPASPEVMQKVRAIAAAAVERDRAAASAARAAAPAEPEPELEAAPVAQDEFWSPMTIVGTMSACALMLAIAATVARRRQTRVLGGG